MRFTSTQICNLQRNTNAIAFAVFATFSLILVACGGGGPGECNEPPPRSFTAVQVQSMTPAETKTLTDVELVSIGTDIQFLSNAALAALRNTVSNPNLLCSPHKAQIESITPTQISALTPARGSLGLGANRIGKA